VGLLSVYPQIEEEGGGFGGKNDEKKNPVEKLIDKRYEVESKAESKKTEKPRTRHKPHTCIPQGHRRAKRSPLQTRLRQQGGGLTTSKKDTKEGKKRKGPREKKEHFLISRKFATGPGLPGWNDGACGTSGGILGGKRNKKGAPTVS